MMEDEVEKCLEAVAESRRDVVYALCVDETGLVLGRSGNPPSSSSSAVHPDVRGAVVSLADAAIGLSDDDANPIVCIDCKTSLFMVHREGRVTSLVVANPGKLDVDESGPLTVPFSAYSADADAEAGDVAK